MASPRVLLLGAGDLTEETCAALEAAGAEVDRLEDPRAEELGEALERGADAVAVVSRDDAWPLRAALLVRHLDADVPIVATIFDPATGRELEETVGNLTITSLADIVAPALAGPCLGDDLAAVLDGDRPTGLRCSGGEVELAPLPEVRARRARALATAVLRPFDRSAALVFFGSVGLALILVAETISAALVLDQSLVDAFYGAVKTLVTVDPNPAVQDGPKWFKVVISLSMLVALLFAAAFTGGLVERLIGRNLTGLLGRRAVPRSDHVVVVGLGQVGLRLCMLLRECGISVVAIDDQPDGENVGHARQLGLPVVIGRGADPSLLRRLSLDQRDRARRGDRRRPAEHQGRARRARRGRRAARRAARRQQRDGRRDALARAARPRARRAPDRRRLHRRPRARARPPRTSSSTATRRTCATRTAAGALPLPRRRLTPQRRSVLRSVLVRLLPALSRARALTLTLRRRVRLRLTALRPACVSAEPDGLRALAAQGHGARLRERHWSGRGASRACVRRRSPPRSS